MQRAWDWALKFWTRETRVSPACCHDAFEIDSTNDAAGGDEEVDTGPFLFFV
jgi:hypothetical protein